MSDKNTEEEIDVDTDNYVFKLPIQYTKHKMLENDIIKNMDFLNYQEMNMPVLHYIFKPETILGINMLDQQAKYYTNNTKFLKETQTLITKLDISLVTNGKISSIQLFHENWSDFKKETSFCEKYLYLDWEPVKFLNNNSDFLQMMSIYNISSPILSLLFPILLLILPFVIIKLKGLPVNIGEYLQILKIIAANHTLVKIFTKFNEVDLSQKAYYFLSLFFYVFSIYQSILLSIRFYSNIKKMHDFFTSCYSFTNHTLEQMDWFIENVKTTTYKPFMKDLRKYREHVSYLHNKLSKIHPFTISCKTLFEIGKNWQLFYELYHDITIQETMEYCLSFWGYVDNLCGLKNNITNKKLNICKFTKKNKMNISNQYYPVLMDKTYVDNSVTLDNNIIITGPNASGKTTLLKTTLINLILSQSVGYGCFKKAVIKPFDYFHCYLNIPDTSGRDSLFQAEARRCKQIIDSVNHYKKQRHFCIIDELYSGTNPEDATTSAQAFMDYISKKNNIIVFLTTHYIDLCYNLKDSPTIQNFCMSTKQSDDKIEFLYKLEPGISAIKGGKFILNEMNYPDEILNY